MIFNWIFSTKARFTPESKSCSFEMCDSRYERDILLSLDFAKLCVDIEKLCSNLTSANNRTSCMCDVYGSFSILELDFVLAIFR